jgi:hypothetical protein
MHRDTRWYTEQMGGEFCAFLSRLSISAVHFLQHSPYISDLFHMFLLSQWRTPYNIYKTTHTLVGGKFAHILPWEGGRSVFLFALHGYGDGGSRLIFFGPQGFWRGCLITLLIYLSAKRTVVRTDDSSITVLGALSLFYFISDLGGL